MAQPTPEREQTTEDLCRYLPWTATDFKARFATEEECRATWIKARWGSTPACAKCARSNG